MIVHIPEGLFNLAVRKQAKDKIYGQIALTATSEADFRQRYFANDAPREVRDQRRWLLVDIAREFPNRYVAVYMRNGGHAYADWVADIQNMLMDFNEQAGLPWIAEMWTFIHLGQPLPDADQYILKDIVHERGLEISRHFGHLLVAETLDMYQQGEGVYFLPPETV